jgi:tetratricopeptide (TPR) repeat protein
MKRRRGGQAPRAPAPETQGGAGNENDPFEAQLSIAAELQQAGREKDAERIYRKLLSGTPGHAGAHYGLGVLLHRRGDDAAALEHLEATTRAWPRHLESRYCLGVSLCRLRRFEEAARELETALRHHPGHAEVCNYLGIVMAELGRPREAERYLQRAIRQRPTLAETYKNLGTLYSELGRIPEAQASLRKAIALKPGYARAWWHLSTIRTFSAGDREVQAMETLLGDESITEEQRVDLGFALGKAYHDLGQHERAFGHWRDANARKRRLSLYDVRPALAEMKAMAEVFTAAPGDVAGAGPVGPTPIFIVGMPRSGTSLVEQILASHPAVHGAGELPLLDQLLRAAVSRFPRDLAGLDADGWSSIATRYAQSAGALAGGAQFVTDKQPANFLHVGAIRRLFPRSPVIHCRRNPQDTALSCFRTHFLAAGLGYTSDLVDLGAWYRHYEALMAHWRRVAGDALHEVVYEELVADPEAEVRKLLASCGLGFEAACLEFHRNRRPVRTASGAQVRQPIYKASVELWRNYERELEPFRRAREGGWQGFGPLLSRLAARARR